MKRAYILLFSALLLTSCKAQDVTPAATVQETSQTTVQETEITEQTTAETEASEETAAETEAPADETSTHATAATEAVGFEGMTPVYADSLNDGTYSINVDSSSSMFKIAGCELTVADGEMTAVLTMGGTGYKYLYMGTEEEAAAADESTYISCDESGEAHKFTVPVEALDKEIDCAAFSRKKEEWYGRILVFRADSLPDEAFAEGTFATAESIGIEDGEYNIAVTLEGGSGRATVQSPAKLTVKDGKAQAEIVWSSNKYDYMIVDGEKLLPDSVEEHSVFTIPVEKFDAKMSVSADTTAMSTPYEIEYTLYFDSSTLEKI